MPFAPSDKSKDYELPDNNGNFEQKITDAKVAIAGKMSELTGDLMKYAQSQGLTSEYGKIAVRISDLGALATGVCDIENGSATDEDGNELTADAADAKLNDIIQRMHALTDAEITEAEKKAQEDEAKAAAQQNQDDTANFHLGNFDGDDGI
jgi:hypothetical protein